MSINQVIHGSNRVVENPNRYKLNAVTGQSNVYDLEKLPGLITDNGTPYNKNILDKIDNILSYLTPEVEKEEIGETTIEFSNIIPKSISPTWNSRGSLNTHDINIGYDSFGDISPQLTIHSLTTNGFYADTSSHPNYNTIYTSYNGSQTTSTAFLNWAKLDHYVSSYSNTFWLGSFEYNFSFGLETKATFKMYATSSSCTWQLQGSNDGVNYTTLNSWTYNISDGTYVSPGFYKYYKLICNNNYNDYPEIKYLLLSNIAIKKKIYKNQFTLDNNGTEFQNNQRVLVETPTMDLDGVTSNTINDISCDTLLQSNTKYELVYNESANKFELGGAGKIIFDTTLASDVNSIDTNIQLNDKKIYKVQFRGSLSSAGSVGFRNEDGNIIAECYVTTSTANPFYSEFMIFDNTTSVIEKGASSVAMYSAYFTGSSAIKTIKANTVSTNIISGTRIIILEV